jgi:hypothetical protein
VCQERRESREGWFAARVTTRCRKLKREGTKEGREVGDVLIIVVEEGEVGKERREKGDFRSIGLQSEVGEGGREDGEVATIFSQVELSESGWYVSFCYMFISHNGMREIGEERWEMGKMLLGSSKISITTKSEVSD